MKKRSSFAFLVLIFAVTVIGAVGLTSQWQRTEVLRAELELARMDARDLQQLRESNQRLRDQQIPAEALEALRADHAALPRLRAEVEALSRAP
jgi:hypothetical protein